MVVLFEGPSGLFSMFLICHAVSGIGNLFIHMNYSLQDEESLIACGFD